MPLEKKILEHLRRELPDYRLQHTLGVRELSLRLADHHGADRTQAGLAALLHDLVRHYNNEELLKLADQCGYVPDEVERKAPYLLHGPLGALKAGELFGIDQEISSAIRKHTLGDGSMTLLDKIIYVADWAEDGRQGETVDEVREWIFRDIDQAMLVALNATLRQLVGNNLLIHPLAVEARNSFIKRNS